MAVRANIVQTPQLDMLIPATDPDEYEHVYEGMCRQAVQGAVYRNELLAADKEGRICRVPYDASKPEPQNQPIARWRWDWSRCTPGLASRG